MSLSHPLAHAQPAGSGAAELMLCQHCLAGVKAWVWYQCCSSSKCRAQHRVGAVGTATLSLPAPVQHPSVCASPLYRSTYQHKNRNVAPVILAINPYKENRDLSNVCWVKVLILKFLMRKFLFIGMYYFVILGAWVILIYVHKIVPWIYWSWR